MMTRLFGFSVAASLVLCALGSARASASPQTLVMFRGSEGLAVYGGTPEDRENRILSPVIGMTRKTAEFITSIQKGQLVRCEFDAIRQDYGKGHPAIVWTVFSVEPKSCVTVGR